MDAARAVFDETLQNEKNEPKPDEVRLESYGGRSDYAVLYDLISCEAITRNRHPPSVKVSPWIEPESDRQ